MFKLSQTSLNKLTQVEPKLKTLVKEVIKITPYNFTITEGLRSLKTQQEYFKKGASKCDGIKNKSKHQANERGLSEAIDIMCLIPEIDKITNKATGKYIGTWEKKYYIEVAKIFKETANQLNKNIIKNEIINKDNQINIRWGGNFTTICDMPHFELI